MQLFSTHNIQLTSNAARRIKALQSIEHNNQLMLRISVSGGGCSDFQYIFDLTEQMNEDDLYVEKDGSKALIDSISSNFLQDCIIEFQEDLTGSAFIIKNPNAMSKCGCGKSFSI